MPSLKFGGGGVCFVHIYKYLRLHLMMITRKKKRQVLVQKVVVGLFSHMLACVYASVAAAADKLVLWFDG